MNMIWPIRRLFQNFEPERFRALGKWSTLSRIGNSYIAKSTILAPFIGAMILFNENIFQYMEPSKHFLQLIGFEPAIDNSSQYYQSRIYYLYIGLFLIGISSVIYSIFCPDTISNFSFIDEYTRSRVSLSSPTICTTSFESILTPYAIDAGVVSWHDKGITDTLSYDDKISSLTYSLLMRMWTDFKWDEEEVENDIRRDTSKDNDELSFDEPGFHNSYMLGTGYIDLSYLAKDLIDSPRVMWGFTIPFKDSSFKFQSDVYHLHYMVEDMSLPIQRLLCFLIYAVGFLFLIIPSIDTFVRVLVGFLSLRA